jgi:hypothetical protein
MPGYAYEESGQVNEDQPNLVFLGADQKFQ